MTSPFHRSEVLFGYLLQLIALVLLLGQHFLLPIGLGLAEYGRLAFVVGSASLLFSAYDYGYNLLGVKKPRLALDYLRCKLVLLAIVGLLYATAAWLFKPVEAHRTVMLPVLMQAVLYVVYTYVVNAELAAGRAKRVVMFSLCNGALLIGVPVAFHLADVGIAYAPLVATAASLAFAASFRFDAAAWRLASIRLGTRRFRWGHLSRSFVKQGQLSFGTIVDALIVWSGVVVAASLYGFEAGAVYRLVMSAVALLTQVIPMPKQALLRVARAASSQAWAGKYAVALVLIGLLQVLAVGLVGKAGIARVFPGSVDAIFHGVLILAPVAALKVILEIETILYDRWNKLLRLIWNAVVAMIPAVVAGLLLDVFWGILVFYLAMVVFSMDAFRLEHQGRAASGRPEHPVGPR